MADGRAEDDQLVLDADRAARAEDDQLVLEADRAARAEDDQLVLEADRAMFFECRTGEPFTYDPERRRDHERRSQWQRLWTSAASSRLLWLLNTPGPDNLLSEALRVGVGRNVDGLQYYWLCPRILHLASTLPSRVDEFDHGGFTPLMRCVQWGDMETGRALLARVPMDVDPTRLSLLPLMEKDRTICRMPTSRQMPTHALSAADFAQALSLKFPTEWRAFASEVVAKTVWYQNTYRPSVSELFLAWWRDAGFVGVLGPLILLYLL
jgi:hypothetical protein